MRVGITNHCDETVGRGVVVMRAAGLPGWTDLPRGVHEAASSPTLGT